VNYQFEAANVMKIGGILGGWFEKNKRELPWRLTDDPYRVWISEVILQQTRVDQGLSYYNNFISTFPDVETLATAQQEEVLKIWQGLGYYSRARNLHQAAKDIAGRQKGAFPGNYNDLLKLKGVGPYTAAAIASICFGEAKAVVDGNVSRVIARLFGVEDPINRPAGERQIALLAQEVMDEAMINTQDDNPFDPGTHNQAVMEFGALHCTPTSPACHECPLSRVCMALLSGKVEQLPLKIKGKKPVAQWFYFYIIKDQKEVILTKRDNKGIWASLYQFPLAECGGPHTEEEMMGSLWRNTMYQPDKEDLSQSVNEEAFGPNPTFTGISAPIVHQLTHRTIHARFIHLELKNLYAGLPEGWIRVKLDEVDQYPLPRLIHRYLESVKI
jgi:A/G-specific adenine glycosylase